MFPANPKNHVMKTRKQEKYHVQYAQTKRFKESALIYMQNLLNQHEKWKLKSLENTKQFNKQNFRKLQEKN